MNVKEFIESLSPIELDTAKIIIEELETTEKSTGTKHYFNLKDKVIHCPHCGCEHVVKNGLDKTGQQRYLCRNEDCGKSFESTTDTFFNHSKMKYDQWLVFIAAEIMKLTLREEADLLGVGLTTCFNMRHKLYNAINKEQFQEKLTGRVEVDSTYTSINLAGFQAKNMPRQSKKRGKHKSNSSYKSLRGLSHHKICIVSAVDEKDNIVFKIAGLGPEALEMYEQIHDSFEENCTIIADSRSCIQKFANKVKASIKVIESGKFATDDGETLSTINQLHQEFGELIRRKHGISTRHLQGYIDWLVFVKRLKYRVEHQLRNIEVYKTIMFKKVEYKTNEITKMPLPIDLNKAYGEYENVVV